MLKSDFISAIAEKTGATKKDVEAIIAAEVEVIVDAIKKNDEVTIPNLGKFLLKETSERSGINPRTKESIKIPAKKMLAFKATKANKEL